MELMREWVIFPFLLSDDLKKNGPHKAPNLNIWSSVGRIVWELVEVMALLEEVCNWGQLLGF